MKRKWTLPLLLMIAALAILPFTDTLNFNALTATNELSEQGFAEDATMEEKMLQLLDSPHLDGAKPGISVMHADSGELLYSRNGNTRLHPASNQKLLTAAAALEVLGADYRFATEVRTNGDLRGPVLHGDLFLIGKGDPTLLKADTDQFAADLKDQGIEKIKGDVVGDDTWYDDVRYSNDLAWYNTPWFNGAPVSGLTLSPGAGYDAGSILVELFPSDGDQAEVRTTPETDYVNIINNTTMVPAGEPRTTWIGLDYGTNDIIITGNMPEDGFTHQTWSSVWEPTGYATTVFKESLEEHGIEFIGNSGELRTDTVPEDTSLLTSKDSMTIEELFRDFMKLSKNAHGETLTKEMGRVVHGEGSWDAGLKVTEEVLADLGVNTDTVLLRDGAGMSHSNYIPSNELAQLLYAVQDKDWFPVFENSLPIMGDPLGYGGGTLRTRLTEEPIQGNVIAKDGLINSVTSLSGYVTTEEGEELIFSIMMNNHLASTNAMTGIEDDIVRMLFEHELGE